LWTLYDVLVRARRCSATADVIDTSVAIAAPGLAHHNGVTLLTSDPTDLTHLIASLNADAREFTSGYCGSRKHFAVTSGRMAAQV
jgi:hypothetical protein